MAALLAIVLGAGTASAVRPREVSSPLDLHAGHNRARSAPTGRLAVVPSRIASRPHRAIRFVIEVEGGLGVNRQGFARTVRRILNDRRGWGESRVRFRQVDSGPAAFRVALASPATTDRLCAPLQTIGIYSCHQNGRAVLNFMRWRRGAKSYGDDLRNYRRYLVNHEVGHALGSYHRGCPGPGVRAPLMMQQTKGVGLCKPNPWPTAMERAGIALESRL